MKSPDLRPDSHAAAGRADRYRQHDGNDFPGTDARLREVPQPQIRSDPATRLLRDPGGFRRREARRTAARTMPRTQSGPRNDRESTSRLPTRSANWRHSDMRPAVDSLMNVEDFAPTAVRRVRFTIRATNDGTEPCLDELEVLARAGRGRSRTSPWPQTGTSVAVSSVFPGSDFHKREH